MIISIGPFLFSRRIRRFLLPKIIRRGCRPIKLTESQIQAARDIDLLSYLQAHAPYSIRKSGRNEYCLKAHDSFKLSNGKWHWFSRGFGGHSALDYLIKVEGMGFVDAVQSLTGEADPTYQSAVLPEPRASPPQPRPPFKLPASNRNNDRVYAYLRGRGIGKELINHCIKHGLLYESVRTHRCVFVGKDGGIPKFACERGTRDNWKKDVVGSDKRFSFHLPPQGARHDSLAVFEGAVDVLAHFEVCRLKESPWDGYRLSLGGTSPLALISFLERHPQIKNLILCLDNDEAGIQAANRIVETLGHKTGLQALKITPRPPPVGKDYADVLKNITQSNIRRSTRHHAGISI